MNWLKAKLRKWLGFDEMNARILDLERHFVTRYNDEGKPIETLADVPLEQRKERETKMRGMSMAQRRAWLEATDGGRNLPN